MLPKRFLLAVLLLFTTQCKERSGGAPYYEPKPVPEEFRAGSLLQQAKDAVDARYALQVDPRFEDAANRLPALLGVAGAAWSAVVADKPVPAHDAFFKERFDHLTELARGALAAVPLEADGAATPAETPLYPVEAALSRLATLNDAWLSRRTAATLLASADACAALVLQWQDDFEVADEVGAHCLALVALASAVDADAARRARAALAHAFQADSYALEMAMGLAADDPLQAFILRDELRLMELAYADRSSLESRVLWYRQVLVHQEKEAEEKNRRRLAPHLKSVSVLAHRLALTRLHENEPIPELLPYLVLDIVAPGKSGPVAGKVDLDSGDRDELFPLLHVLTGIGPVPDQRILGALGNALASRGLPTSLWDADMTRAVWRGYAYSGLFLQVEFVMRRLGSLQGSKALLKSLEGPTDEAGKAFLAFADIYYKLKFEAPDTRRVVRALSPWPAGFKGGPAVYALNAFVQDAAWSDPNVVEMMGKVAAQLDTRPAHRKYLSDMARLHLYDLNLAERELAWLAQESPHSHITSTARYAEHRGDLERLADLADTPGLPNSTLTWILDLLSEDKIRTRSDREKVLRTLIAGDPADYRLRVRLIEFLEGRNRNPEAREVATDWLMNYGDSTPGLAPVIVQTKIARALTREGKLEEALAAVNLVRRSMYGPTLERRGRILAAMGRHEEAEAQCDEAEKRYPNSATYAVVRAENRWLQEDWKGAADALAHPNSPIPSRYWEGEFIPQFFIEAMFGKPREDVLAAVDALAASGLDPWYLNSLAQALSKAGHHDLAFAVYSRLPGEGQVRLQTSAKAFYELQFEEGSQAALKWLDSRVQPGDHGIFAMLAFDTQAYSLIFDFVADPHEQNEHSDFVWLLRAAASTRSKRLSEDHGEAVRKHFAGDGFSYYHVIGRYLLGLATEEELLALDGRQAKVTEVAYYMALKADAEGRHRDAEDLFRLVAEQREANEGEYRWAMNGLYWLAEDGHFLSNEG